jgi:hypothetical protein
VTVTKRRILLRTIQAGGLVVFAVMAILLAIGTYRYSQYVTWLVIAAAGVAVFYLARRLDER